MLTMRGKYNTANIMIDTIDDTTKEQIQTFLNHPAFANTYIAIQPDCHKGVGAVIGFTMKMNKYIIPSVVGVDIGCGMLSAKLPITSFNPSKFDEFVKKNIPAGFAIHATPQVNTVGLLRGTNCINCITRIDGLNYSKIINSIGTLGGGNHFIEVGQDSQENFWVTIHSGSRNFGLRIANYYQQVAKDGLKKYFINEDQYKNLEFLLVDTQDGQDYIEAARIAQRYAKLNRKTMLENICNFFETAPTQIIESVHNFIGEDNIIRKGATSAKEGERVIIPFNMRDGIALCTGKGSPKYIWSAQHGAGRILSRTQARQRLSIKDFQNGMQQAGVYTTTATIDTIDESPDAYKNKDIILENIQETVTVDDFIKPIYNFKAGG